MEIKGQEARGRVREIWRKMRRVEKAGKWSERQMTKIIQ
jgi:hypothetical protein